MIAKGGTGSQCAASLRGRTELAHPTAARTGHGTQGAYTQQQEGEEKKKKKKDAGLAESCLFCAGLQLEERSFCACCLNGRERRERVWTPEGFLFSALDFSALCFGRFVTRPQSACCDSSNHNSRVRLAITRDELFYFGALLDKQAECIMTGVKEPLV